MPRRVLEGTVVSAKQDKTVTVLVERRTMHPVYKKYLKKSKKFAAHDESNHYKEGDQVSIVETRPISKNKSWAVLIDGKEVAAPKKDEKKVAKAPKKDVKETTAKKAAPKKAEKTAKPAAKKTETAKKAAPKKAAAKKETAKKDTKK